MPSTIFTLIVGGASIYFFYQYNFLVGVILLVWAISRLFGYSLTRLFEGTAYSELERKSNVAIELKVNIAETLKHKEVAALFERLKKEGFKFQNFHEWTETLIGNYKKKHNNQNDYTSKEDVRYIWEIVRFNIKNNVLWKNNEIDFNDSIYHEIFIPYKYKGAKEEEERFFYGIDNGIRIRVFVVNGIIKLQVGHFDKATTPNMIREEGLAAYQTYTTITSFPLMYISQSIPVDYLNLSMYATESWKDLLRMKKGGDFTKDWKEINKEVREYAYIKNKLALDTPASDKKLTQLFQKFYKKGLEMLAKENFIDPNKRKDDDWPVPGWMENNDIHYLNNYLYILIADYKDLREKREKYYYTDYYEEQP